MKRDLNLAILSLSLLLSTQIIGQDYKKDILGDGYLSKTIEMGYDYEGRVVSTIIRKGDILPGGKAVLYIHGYVDYFFQKEMGDKFYNEGINFYAVDLRKYGRSILPGQQKFNVRNLKEYYADLDSAITIIKREGNDKIILIGHSTGGLIAPLYADSKKWRLDIKGIILNSPFLDMNQSAFTEKIAVPAGSTIGLFSKKTKIRQSINRSYGESLHTSKYGEWDFDTTKKMIQPPPVTTGWLRAIHKGHKKIRRKLNILVPILVMSSDKSIHSKHFSTDIMKADAVLDVKDIQRLAPKLGINVKKVVIPGGMHDLVLSQKDVREKTYKIMLDWAKEVF